MGMAAVLRQTLQTMSDDVPRPKEEYIGEDGLKHCAVCHARVERPVDIPALNIQGIVRCVCKCGSELDVFNERQKQEALERQRRICFAETNMISWSFENDDRKNPKISDAMQRYAEMFSDFRKEGRGLLLHGPVGTGKTYYASCIANRLIDDGYTVFMRNLTKLVNEIQSKDFSEKQIFIDSLNKYSLLILDDLGVERETKFMLEQVYNIIDARYRSGLPMIITTNLPMETIKKPQDVEHSRIYDRILERCFPVEVPGISRRRQNVKSTFYETKERLGL